MGLLYRLDFPNGKSYVGITTKTAERRFKGHKCEALKGKATVLYNAWRKHGDPVLVVVSEMDDKLLAQAEIDAIKEFSTLRPNGYNMTTGGDISPMLMPEIVKSFSESKKGTRPAQQAFDAALLATKGKKRPSDVVARMSLNGSMRRPETRAKQAATMARPEIKLKYAMAQFILWAKRKGVPFSQWRPRKEIK